MSLLRPDSRPRASADLGYRLFAGVVAGSLAELLGIAAARELNPDRPNYLVPTVLAVGAGVVMAIVDPVGGTSYGGPGWQEESGYRYWLGDAWIAPDGTITPAPYGHETAALDIIGIENLEEPTDEELRCCGVDVDMLEEEEEPDFNPGCVAETRLGEQGYQRMVRYPGSSLGFELFSEPTNRQVNVLKRYAGGPNIGLALDVDLTSSCGEEHLNHFRAMPGLLGPRLRAIDDAVEAMREGDFSEAY